MAISVKYINLINRLKFGIVVSNNEHWWGTRQPSRILHGVSQSVIGGERCETGKKASRMYFVNDAIPTCKHFPYSNYTTKCAEVPKVCLVAITMPPMIIDWLWVMSLKGRKVSDLLIIADWQRTLLMLATHENQGLTTLAKMQQLQLKCTECNCIGTILLCTDNTDCITILYL